METYSTIQFKNAPTVDNYKEMLLFFIVNFIT
jgi:hypothetical protein